MDRVQFTINGKKFSAGSEISVDTYLNEFIRRYADLRGTKYMCLEGGCGACVVTVCTTHPSTKELITFSVNSLLMLLTVHIFLSDDTSKRDMHIYHGTTHEHLPNIVNVEVMSCDSWNITTIEGIGNRKSGYNIIQKRLNHYFGSQCGYCSPGFVMSMYSIVQSNDHHLTEKEIEESFGSNLCRCTGYRPILEAFKSLASKPDPSILKKIMDIEDINEQMCPKSGEKCRGTCEDSDPHDWCLVNVDKTISAPVLPKKISLADGRQWYAVGDIRSIFSALSEIDGASYMLLSGNTSRGAHPIKFYPKHIIDISNVAELKTHYLDVNLVLGGNITLNDTLNLFNELSKTNEEFWYLKVLYKHLKKVAHIPVRNIGTLAGNLVLKHDHPEFQSDIFLLFECLQATVTLVNRNLSQTEMNLTDFLNTDIDGIVLKDIRLPPLSRHYEIVTYKISLREQNSHAEVNSAFLFKFNPYTHQIEKSSIVYGGIHPKFTHAFETEKFLIGRNIFNNEVLQSALRHLESDIYPDVNPPEPSPWYRRKLAQSLFYKCIIKLCPRDILNPIYKSGATTPSEDRPPVSRSYQEYDTNKPDYPITQPLLKKEGIIQCAGEAMYADDLSTDKNEVFASFVLSRITKGEIESIDGSKALEIDGVIAVLTSADIPGVNSLVRSDFRLMYENEELMASERVRYYNQPIAIVIAETQVLADKMTCLVEVNYKNVSHEPAVFTIEDAIQAPNNQNRLIPYTGIFPTDRGVNVTKVIKGKFISPRQYHNTMELHTTVTKPIDDRFEVYSSSQYIDLTQSAIAQLLKIPENLVIVKTTRCGGGFGCKIGRQNFAACATALVAKKFNRTCRMAMHMTDIMRAIGKRPNSRLDYEVGVDQRGEIQYMDAVFYVNDGHSRNENQNSYSTESLKNCYNPNRWKVESFGVITDAPSNCFMRAPGGFEGISAIEHIMEHIAAEIQRDPVEVRIVNYAMDDNELPVLMPVFMKKTDYIKRQKQVKEYNSLNRWKKRAIRLNNMAFPTAYIGNYSAVVSVYHGDGSVVINTGGIEVGQGIFTRLAQVAANEFRISVEKVAVLPSYNFVTPNNFATASSITTQSTAYAVIRSCDQINARLAPIRAAMPSATWEEVVFEADLRGILLQANYQASEYDPRFINYSVFGIATTEVEIDVLTGRKWIVRADVFEDAGRSINPALDVGQVEGAFVQSLSAWTVENTVYNEKSGEIYTDRTWNYKIFGAKDIPYDFRVYLRRKAVNPVGILGSKAVAEPPTCLGHVVVDSLREAIQASRSDSGYDTKGFLDISVPVTNEHVVEAEKVKIEEYLLY